MSVVTISRGSYSRGKEVAEKVAQRLGYECVSREILVEASEEFDVPEVKLLHAIQDAPSVLDRFTFGKERYIAFIQARPVGASSRRATWSITDWRASTSSMMSPTCSRFGSLPRRTTAYRLVMKREGSTGRQGPRSPEEHRRGAKEDGACTSMESTPTIRASTIS